MLRLSVVVVCVALALTAGAQIALGRPYGWLPVGIEAAIVAILVVVERGRYRPRVDSARGTWQATGERFRDPTSGELVDVYADAETGARDYRPAGN
jgi:hypothetical protein